jgi:histidine triad (HIT) family protein
MGRAATPATGTDETSPEEGSEAAGSADVRVARPRNREEARAMQSVFARIIAGELPARFVWKDDRCVAFSSSAPLRPGHTLLVPREPVDHWIDASAELRVHLFDVAHRIATGIAAAWQPRKVALMIAGLEVLHLHIHLVPVWDVHDLDFEQQDNRADPRDLDAAAARLRDALRELGYDGVSE